MTRLVLTVLVALVASSTSGFAGEPATGQAAEAPSISAGKLHEQRAAGEAPVVIDVRTAAEFASGHVPGAVNIPFDEVADRIGEVEAPHGVALYCMVGPRARKGEAALLAAGYDRVFHLEGGLAAWQEAGLPVDRSE
jgi:rhodanese-related sulfurtransferase